jgi:pyridoxine kinase
VQQLYRLFTDLQKNSSTVNLTSFTFWIVRREHFHPSCQFFFVDSLLFLAVMGDAGHLYVAPDVIPVYRKMLPLATIITPNWFEVEWVSYLFFFLLFKTTSFRILTDIKLENLAALQRALKILHEQYNVPNVVITSIPLSSWLSTALPTSIRPLPSTIPSSRSSSSSSSSRSTSPLSSISVDRDVATDAYLLCISSTIDQISHTSTSLSTVHAQIVPLIPGYFSGVGDLFSALLLAHFHPSSSSISTPLSHASSLALSKTHSLLRLTYSNTFSLPEEERLPSDDELDYKTPLRKTRRMRGRELALIKGQGIIRGEEEGVRRQMMPWDGFWELEGS